MKKNSTKELDYFLMKTDFFNEMSVRKLCYHGDGAQSAAIFITILCFLYKNGYYIEDTEEIRSKMLQKVDGTFTSEELQETIQLSLEIGLFNKELYENERILTSRDIQECYLISHPGRKKPEITMYNLINNTENEA